MTSTKSKDIWKITNDILNNTKQMDEWINNKWPLSHSLLHGNNKEKKDNIKIMQSYSSSCSSSCNGDCTIATKAKNSKHNKYST